MCSSPWNSAYPVERIAAGVRHQIRNFDTGLVHEKDRDPPLALLLKLAAVAREADDEKLAQIFQWAFYEQITAATRGHRISFIQEDDTGGENAGLLLTTFGPGQFELASAFSTAPTRMREEGDGKQPDKARRALDSLRQSILPGLKPSLRKK
jgi:hypothetical protein